MSPAKKQGVVFVVPVKARESARQWSDVEANLRRTLRSATRSLLEAGVLAEDAIIVPHHDEPDIGESAPFVRLLKVDFPKASSPGEGTRDKSRKRRWAGAWLREHADDAAHYVAFLDADDLVHRQLVPFVLATNAPSYLIDDGYLYASEKKLLIRQPLHFHRTCGSSFVCRFWRNELPVSWEDDQSQYGQFGSSPEQRGHQDYDLVAREQGKHPVSVPFPAAVYVANHSESLWVSKGRKERAAAHPRQVISPRKARGLLKHDFSADDLATTSAGTIGVSLERARAARRLISARVHAPAMFELRRRAR